MGSIAPHTKEGWFRSDRRSAIVLSIGVPATAAVLVAVRLWVNPSIGWREVWLPIFWIAWLIPIAWGQAYLARRMNHRRKAMTGKDHPRD